MKNLLFLTTLTLLSTGIYSQEKQNDATWEETISFIKENLSIYNFVTHSNPYGEINNTMTIDNKGLLILTRKYRDGSSGIFKANLKNLIEIRRLLTPFSIDLVFEDYSVEINDGRDNYIRLPIYRKRDHYDKNKNELHISEKAPLFNRMLKAWTHLAYLANEKRKNSKF